MAGFATEYKDLLTISFSALSFIVAGTALFFSARTAIRDKERLLITARSISDSFSEAPYEIEVAIVNIGKRVAVIEGIRRHYENGMKSHMYKESGILLKEKERVVLKISSDMLIENEDEGEVYYLKDFTVLDIQGKEHKVKNSKELVKRLVSNL
ncbi:hypothetical protein OQJ40_11290 [Serratia nevei]|uniref:hypothetical protein n=1 Tax=Serratia nevei TaxID=2703794 RepID=UPI0027D280FA|nr:hypothetical protein [Serratia nevei]WMC77823.1 hypothetical protein O8I25_12050 [Serratia nevei]WMC83094.1 hypothetical protein O8I24_11290 [Serratia nevei]